MLAQVIGITVEHKEEKRRNQKERKATLEAFLEDC